MSKWIFCDDAKPPKDLDVLFYVVQTFPECTIMDEYIVIGCYNGKYFEINGIKWDCENVVAWTLLPEKPWKEIYEKGKANVQ